MYKERPKRENVELRVVIVGKSEAQKWEYHGKQSSHDCVCVLIAVILCMVRLGNLEE